VLIAGAVVGIFAYFLYDGPAKRNATGKPEAALGRSAPAPTQPTIPPWEARPENAPGKVPEHQIPAWKVLVPPPVAWTPPPPVEPPNPITHPPPMHNPGGYDGDRPPRPVPGLKP